MRRFNSLRLSIALPAVIFGTLTLAALPCVAEENWSSFGGPAGDFTTKVSGTPVTWTADDVAWRTELGGVGQSSPIVWGEQIFLTTAESTGDKVTRNLLCISRKTGEILWKKACSTGPGESLHKMNTWATPSCATDGEHLLAYFGPGGLHCFTLDGDLQWSQQELVGEVGAWGFAASPIILGDRVIQNADALGKSFLAAYQIANGKEVWRTERRDTPRGGWSTPILIDGGTRKELVVNGEFGVTGYDPETGEEFWTCKSFNGRGTPVPAFTQGLVVTVNGKPGDIYAVKPGGAGDVTDSHMAWHTARRGGRDLPSPVAVDGFVFVVSMAGVGTMYDVKGGKEIWQARIGGNFSATPFVADGLIYVTSEAGETIVIRPGDKLDVVAKNSVGDVGDEIFRASSTPSGGNVLIRSQTALYCVGKN